MPRDLLRLPKADLHIHLDASMRPSTVVEIASESGVDLQLPDGPPVFRGPQHFFEHVALVRACLRTPEHFRRIAYELCEDEAAEGVRYAEVTFTAGMHGARLGDWEMPVAAVLEGFAQAEADFGIRCRLVLDHSRRRPMDWAWRSFEVALRHRDAGVVAIGLAGDEAYPIEPYVDLFRKAREAGLHSVPHAGELAGPQSIRDALGALGAERIGHGFRAAEDPELMAELQELRIPLELCLTSNLALSLIPSLDEHPLPQLLSAGVIVTLNTDVPALFSSPISGEYEVARRVFGMDDVMLAELARAGVRASFADGATRNTIERDIDAWLAAPAASVEPSACQ